MKLIFEKSIPGRTGFRLPKLDVEMTDINIEKDLIRDEKAKLPEVFELDVVRHFESLERINHSVDRGFYPLGSCTMKYNPYINDETAAYSTFLNMHPYMEDKYMQGSLMLMHNLQEYLAELTGMDTVTLQPAAGAHGELTGMMLIRAYLEDNGFTNKTKVLVPDSAHGTNPATAIMAGFNVVEVKSNENGRVDLEEYKKLMNDDVAAIMLTNPNTVGLFESDILEIAKIAHEHNALLYYDGANLNAIMGMVRPGDMGFDVVHLNLHKTLSTPHGMGGPGSGAVGAKKRLEKYLPKPVVVKEDEHYKLKYDIEKSIGRVRSFYGNFSVLVRAYTYIVTMGADGLKKASELAVLNANYMREKLKDTFDIEFPGICKHEFVINGSFLKEYDLKTMDFAKRLLDYGIHPSTIYFPLIVKEAMMFEPTETESKETLDDVIGTFKHIIEEAKKDPETLHQAPVTTPIRRINEVKGNKDMKTKY